MRPCLALLVVLFALASIALANDPSSALAKPSDSPALRIPPLPADKRYAYVTIHYEGTPRDADYILGLRTLVASIKNSGSKQDIVVLCSDNVSQSTRDLLHEDGAIVKIVQNVENPFKTDKNKRNKYQAHFEYTMNKLYLWNMTEYERVIYMDEDNIALYNVDELFFCGHFCVVFLNPLFFHTGLMVVKPNTAKFNELYDKLMHRDSYSFDGADQGFLVAQFRHLEAAPLFDPTQGPSEEPMQRLSLGYNFNHVYHYPFFAWDTHRWNPRFRDLPIPIMTIGYPITQFLKPWCWWPSIFFDLHYLWQQQRATVTHDPFDGMWVLSRLLIIAAVYSGSLWVLHFLSTQASRFTVLPRKLVTACSVTIGPVASGSIAGLAAILIPQIFFINKMLPQLAPPMKAYPLFILYANVCIFVCLCFFALLHSVSFPRPIYMGFVPVPNSSAPVFNMMIPSILLYFFTWFCGFLPIYNSFVPKIIALFVTACLCVLNQINLFVTVARNGVRDVKANFSHKT